MVLLEQMGTFSEYVRLDPVRNQLNQNLLWDEVQPGDLVWKASQVRCTLG